MTADVTGDSASDAASDGAATGRARRRFSRSGWVVPLLDALIEGAWIAVIDAAFAALGGRDPLGPIPFAIAAGASLFWVRNAGDRTTSLVGLAVLYAIAVVGAGLLGAPLSDTAAVGAAAGFSQSAAILSALAVFRGSRHVEPADDDLTVGSLLQWGFPLLAIPWLWASQQTDTVRDAFAAAAFPATLVFAAAGLLALGLARLDALASLSGVNWRGNRAWFVLLGCVLLAMVMVAVPAAFLLGTPLTLLVAGLLGPAGFILGPIGALLLKFLEFVFFLLSPLINFIQSLIQDHKQEGQPAPIGDPGQLPPQVTEGEPSTVGLILGIGLLVAITLIVFVVVLRLTYRRRAPDVATPGEALEEREFRLPHVALRRPGFGLRSRRRRPETASDAYLAFLADLEAAPDLARAPDEPPATHAARLRREGFSDPRAALLAADYELERYALREVTSGETRRALRRQVHLREVLKARPRRPPPTAEGDAAT